MTKMYVVADRFYEAELDKILMKVKKLTLNHFYDSFYEVVFVGPNDEHDYFLKNLMSFLARL